MVSVGTLIGENTPQSPPSLVFGVCQRQSNQRGSKCVNDKICESVLCYAILLVSVFWCLVVVFIFLIINIKSKRNTCFRPSVSSHKLWQTFCSASRFIAAPRYTRSPSVFLISHDGNASHLAFTRFFHKLTSDRKCGWPAWPRVIV